MLGAIDLVRVESNQVVRDVTVACGDAAHAEAVVRAVRDLEGVEVDSVSDRTFLMHKGGKIEVTRKAAAEDARRPLDGLHAGRRPRVDGDPRGPARRRGR